MKRRVLMIVVGLCMILTSALHAGGKNEVSRLIGPEDAYEMMIAGDAIMIDVRALGDYAESHIAGAVSIPYADISTGGRQLADQPKTIITYCSCPAEETSQAAAIELRDAGITNVRVLKGGIQGWQSVGLPVNSGNRP